MEAKGKADLMGGFTQGSVTDSLERSFGGDQAEMVLLLLWIKFAKYSWIYIIFK